MDANYVRSLAAQSVSLEEVGGKGLSLTKMINAGLPVPCGFHITTGAYREFIEKNHLQPVILGALEGIDPDQPAALEATAQMIARAIAGGRIPPNIREAIVGAYEAMRLSEVPAAVRSSATAEDLPGASFAGQQDTYLNICGVDALLAAVQKCWASLWTARAIAYRIKNHIDQKTVALAVVVQAMVRAEASGVLFTANPISGRRDEAVINAAWGLGEAIVGGIVTPDTIVADKVTGQVKHAEISDKAVIIVPVESGTVEQPLTGPQRTARVLDDAQVSELVAIARQIEGFYNCPQDIEWCWSGGHFSIVQSRPITTLPVEEAPEPKEWKLPRGAYAAMRNNIVELMPAPLSPLFATMGLAAINASMHRILNDSFAMQGIMPPDIVIVVNNYAYNNGSVSARGMLRLFGGTGRIARKMFTGAVERWTETGRPRYHAVVEEWRQKDPRSFSAAALLDGARLLTEAAIDAYGSLISGAIPAAWITEAVFTNVYNRFIKRRSDPPAPTYLLGYESLPIRADKSLFRLAEWARQEPALARSLLQSPATRLVDLMERGETPDDVPQPVWQEWVDRFHAHMHSFGHTIYDLDFMHPTPADDPAPVINTFKLYLSGKGADPFARQLEMAERRERETLAMRQRISGRRLRWFNRYLASAQKYALLREDGLAEIGMSYPLIRRMLRELGRRFAEQQLIPAADDIYWLTDEEVRATAARPDAGTATEPLADAVAGRKAQHRAALRVQPPMALPQMKVFGFDLMSLKGRRGKGKGNLIKGVAASPGRVTGTARILRNSDDFEQMQPGEILVAPITTPAWTPLFAMAAAIVTDVGGPLSHGSIVAREYGIPAVLGTGAATHRIYTGQKITVDGSAGIVTLMTD